MEKFVISPEDCLILKAFRDSNSLREAATLLHCDPAGLARRVQVISSQHGFLQKVNNRWQVSSKGLDLVAWVEESIQSQSNLIMSKRQLRIASTMWFAETQVVPNLPKLKNHFDDETSFLVSVPDKGFEHALIGGAVDFVIVCHPPENPEIEHRQIAKEKWIAVAPIAWQKDFKEKGEKTAELLQKRPFIRHVSLNEDLFLPDLKIQDSGIVIDNLVGVRSAVCAGFGWSLAPKFLVEREIKEKNLIEIPYEIPVHDRMVCVWWLRSRSEAKKKSAKVSMWLKEICS